MFHYILVVLAVAALPAASQTRVDLRSQGKSIDFSAAASTRPVKTGISLPGVCQIGDLFFQTSAPSGSNLYGCVASNTWVLQSGGAATEMQLYPLMVTRSSATVLQIGAECSMIHPCNVRFGNLTYSIQTGSTATIGGTGSGLAFVYISSSGQLTVGHQMSVSCSGGCVSQIGVSGYPPDAIPLFTWSASNGNWDLLGGVDHRAVLSSKPVLAGLGLQGVENGGVTTIAADATVLAMRVSPPATATAACSVGNWAVDATYFYVCIGANSWKRAEVLTW